LQPVSGAHSNTGSLTRALAGLGKRSSVVDPYLDHWILIQGGPWIRIANPDPDPRGQNRPDKWKQLIKRAEGFTQSFDVLYGGLGISKLQFLTKKTKKEKY
jgi:hypothetical protein